MQVENRRDVASEELDDLPALTAGACMQLRHRKCECQTSEMLQHAHNNCIVFMCRDTRHAGRNDAQAETPTNSPYARYSQLHMLIVVRRARARCCGTKRVTQICAPVSILVFRPQQGENNTRLHAICGRARECKDFGVNTMQNTAQACHMDKPQ